MEIFSHGKLVISGEYLVLLGAEAFALPTQFGQTLKVNESKITGVLSWTAFNHLDEVWFEAEFDLNTLAVLSTTNRVTANDLRKVLSKAKDLNPAFLINETGLSVETHIDFPVDWGLGSSSTLICNIAKWSETNAFELSEASFGGSGVDIAVGMTGSELLYARPPAWDSFVFNPPFKDQLLFVHLGQKQNSREEIKKFSANQVDEAAVHRISAISRELGSCTDLSSFKALLEEHESIMSQILKRSTVKQERFPDYAGVIKSLGAWGGDFVLAIADQNPEHYFRNKGYSVIIPYSRMIKK